VSNSEIEIGRAGGDTSFGDVAAHGGHGGDSHGEAHGPGGYTTLHEATDDLDVQIFPVDGTWIKHERAESVEMIVVAAGGGGAPRGRDGGSGQMVIRRFAADELPAAVEIEVGKGGRGGVWDGIKGGDGANGLVVVATTLRSEQPS
jgi:hypothetical protein